MEQSYPGWITKGTSNSPEYSNDTDSTASLPRQRRVFKKMMFNDEQLNRLEALYSQDKYPSGEKRCEVAEELGVSDYKLKVWFQNRRMKEKRKRMAALHSLALISRQLYTDNLAKIEERFSPVHTAVQSLANLSTPPVPSYSPQCLKSCCGSAYSPEILRQDNTSPFSPHLSGGTALASPSSLRYDNLSSPSPRQGLRTVSNSPIELSRRNQYVIDSNFEEHTRVSWRHSASFAPKTLLPTFYQGLPSAVQLPVLPPIRTGLPVPFHL